MRSLCTSDRSTRSETRSFVELRWREGLDCVAALDRLRDRLSRVAGVRLSSPLLRWQALALFAFTTLKVFFADLSNLSGFYRIISSIALGVVLLVISFLYQRSLRAQRDHDTLERTCAARLARCPRDRERLRRARYQRPGEHWRYSAAIELPAGAGALGLGGLFPCGDEQRALELGGRAGHRHGGRESRTFYMPATRRTLRAAWRAACSNRASSPASTPRPSWTPAPRPASAQRASRSPSTRTDDLPTWVEIAVSSDAADVAGCPRSRAHLSDDAGRRGRRSCT